MKIGNTSINVMALGSITKEEFIEMNRGKIMNIEAEARKLSKYFKQEEFSSYSEQPKKSKNRKRK